MTVSSPFTTTDPFLFELNFGTALPAFNEEEIYMQAMVLLPSGALVLSNRERLDIEGTN